jgi:small subunit ribosomal protein S27e
MKEVPTSRFVKVKCKCGNEQNVFGSASSVVKCAGCDEIVATPTGGKAKIKAKIVKLLE